MSDPLRDRAIDEAYRRDVASMADSRAEREAPAQQEREQSSPDTAPPMPRPKPEPADAGMSESSLFSRLQKLNKDGTPGPWVLASDAGIVARHCETAEHDVRIPNTPFNGDEDEALIVECRNSLPAVLDLIEAAQQAIERKDVLPTYTGDKLREAVAVFVSGQEEQP